MSWSFSFGSLILVFGFLMHPGLHCAGKSPDPRIVCKVQNWHDVARKLAKAHSPEKLFGPKCVTWPGARQLQRRIEHERVQEPPVKRRKKILEAEDAAKNRQMVSVSKQPRFLKIILVLSKAPSRRCSQKDKSGPQMFFHWVQGSSVHMSKQATPAGSEGAKGPTTAGSRRKGPTRYVLKVQISNQLSGSEEPTSWIFLCWRSAR